MQELIAINKELEDGIQTFKWPSCMKCTRIVCSSSLKYRFIQIRGLKYCYVAKSIREEEEKHRYSKNNGELQGE